MKKHLLFIAFLFCTSTYAQTLTYQNFAMTLGFTGQFLVPTQTSAATIPVNTSGMNVTWNCSGLLQEPGTPTINYTIDDPSTTPYYFNYPNTNWCGFDPNLTALTGYEYCKITHDSLTKYGNNTPGTDSEIYDDPDKKYVFPFSYTNTATDNYAKNNYDVNGNFTSYQTGTRSFYFDAYGTLILPSGTYSNVGRIIQVRTNSLGPDQTNWTWIDLTTGRELMMVSSTGSVFYSGSNSVGINIQKKEIGSLYPTVNHGRFNVVVNEPINSTITITDVNGKLILSHPTNDILNQLEMNIASGFYNVRVNSGTSTSSFRMMVE